MSDNTLMVIDVFKRQQITHNIKLQAKLLVKLSDQRILPAVSEIAPLAKGLTPLVVPSSL